MNGQGAKIDLFGPIKLIKLIKQVELSNAKLSSLSWVELNWVELRQSVAIIPINLNLIELKVEPP